MSSATCSSSDDERDSAWAQANVYSKVLPSVSSKQQPCQATTLNSLPAISSSSGCCSSGSSDDDEDAGIDISTIVFSRIDWDKQDQTVNTAATKPQQPVSRQSGSYVEHSIETTTEANGAQSSNGNVVYSRPQEQDNSEPDASDAANSSSDSNNDDVDGDVSDTGNGWLSGAAGRIANLNTPRRHDWDQVRPGIETLLTPKTPQQVQEEELAITQQFMAATSCTQTARETAAGCSNPDVHNTGSIEECIGEHGTEQAAEHSCLAAVVLDVGGMDMQDLDQLIARLQAGPVYDLSTTRPSDLPDPSTLFTDDEDDDTPYIRPATACAHTTKATTISLGSTKVDVREQDVLCDTTTRRTSQQCTDNLSSDTASMGLTRVGHPNAVAPTIPDGNGKQHITPPAIPQAMPPKFGGKFRLLPQAGQSVQPAAPVSSLQSKGEQDSRRTVTVDLRSCVGVAGQATAVPQKAVSQRSGTSNSGTTTASRSMFVSTCDLTAGKQQPLSMPPQSSAGAVVHTGSHGSAAPQPKARHVPPVAAPVAVSVQMDTEDDWPASSLQVASQGVQSYNRTPAGAPGHRAGSGQDDGLCIVTAGTRIACPAGIRILASKTQAAVACDSACQCDVFPEDEMHPVSASFSPRCSSLSNLENGPALGVGHGSISTLRQTQVVAA